MMASPVVVFYLPCLFLGQMAQISALNFSSSVHQESSFVFAKSGDNLTLRCLYEGDVAARYYWFKETLGQKPRLISTFYVYERNGTFYEEFKNNPRFTLDTSNGKNDLKISDLHISDSATYYCIRCFLYTLEISESIVVNVKDSGMNIQTLVHQSASDSIQPGGSVTLSCTVHTGTCDGEHSVYWFRVSSESHPGLIYTHGDRNDQCERKPNTQTHTCVYNLPMENLNLSHAGTYYCAVASCGHILFGNGTKLDFEDEVDLAYFWHGVSAFAAILSVVLAFSLCMMTKRSSSRTTESPPQCTAPSTADAEGYQHTENLYYAALSINLSKRSRRSREQTWSECVYYSVKQ